MYARVILSRQPFFFNVYMYTYLHFACSRIHTQQTQGFDPGGKLLMRKFFLQATQALLPKFPMILHDNE